MYLGLCLTFLSVFYLGEKAKESGLEKGSVVLESSTSGVITSQYKNDLADGQPDHGRAL